MRGFNTIAFMALTLSLSNVASADMGIDARAAAAPTCVPCAPCTGGLIRLKTPTVNAACPICDCIPAGPGPITSIPSTPVPPPTGTSCPTFSCASCPAGLTQTLTTIGTACPQCACAGSTTTLVVPTTSVSTSTASVPAVITPPLTTLPIPTTISTTTGSSTTSAPAAPTTTTGSAVQNTVSFGAMAVFAWAIIRLL